MTRMTGKSRDNCVIFSSDSDSTARLEVETTLYPEDNTEKDYE